MKDIKKVTKQDVIEGLILAGAVIYYLVTSLQPDSYKKYLRSPQWAIKREKVLRRDGYKCTQCGSKRSLQVHHKTYARIYKEKLEDLVTLCKKCHKKVHGK